MSEENRDKPESGAKQRPAAPSSSAKPVNPARAPSARPSQSGSASTNRAAAQPGSRHPPSNVPAPARPARPQAPVRPAAGPKLEGVLETQEVQSIESVMPSGLSTSTYLPSARRDPALDRRARIRRRYTLLLTALPSALVLSVSMLLLAGGWFLLDQDSLLRSNTLGMAIPLTLFALSATFALAVGLLMSQTRSLHRQMQSMSEN